jgi:hypothetical protein
MEENLKRLERKFALIGEEITRGCLGFGRRGFWKNPSIT